MKRDEEILYKELSYISFLFTDDSNLEINIKQSMEEQSTNFAEFCAKEFCPTIQNGLVHWTKETYQNNDKIYTTKEVYEIFNSNNK